MWDPTHLPTNNIQFAIITILIVHSRSRTSSFQSFNNFSKGWACIWVLVPTIFNQCSIPFRTCIWNWKSFLMRVNHHCHLLINSPNSPNSVQLTCMGCIPSYGIFLVNSSHKFTPKEYTSAFSV